MPLPTAPVPKLTDCIGQLAAATAPLLAANKVLSQAGGVLAASMSIPFNTIDTALQAFYALDTSIDALTNSTLTAVTHPAVFISAQNNTLVAGISTGPGLYVSGNTTYGNTDVDKAILGFRAACLVTEAALYNIAGLCIHGSSNVSGIIQREIKTLQALKQKLREIQRTTAASPETDTTSVLRALCEVEALNTSVITELKATGVFNVPIYTSANTKLCAIHVTDTSKDTAVLQVLNLLDTINRLDVQVAAYKSNITTSNEALSATGLVNISELLITLLESINTQIRTLQKGTDDVTLAAQLQSLCRLMTRTLELYKTTNTVLTSHNPVAVSVRNMLAALKGCGDGAMETINAQAAVFVKDRSGVAELTIAIDAHIKHLACLLSKTKRENNNVSTALTAVAGAAVAAEVGARIYAFLRNSSPLKDSFNLLDLAGLLGFAEVHVLGLDRYMSALQCLAAACLNPYLRSKILDISLDLQVELRRRNAPFLTMHSLTGVPSTAVRLAITKQLEALNRKVNQLQQYTTSKINSLCKG